MTQDSRDLETQFLELTGLSKIDFQGVVRPSTPEDQLQALTAIWTSGKLASVPKAEVLGMFQKWNTIIQRVDRTSILKYRLTLALTFWLLGAGLLSMFFRLLNLSDNVALQLLLLLPSVSLVGILLAVIIRANLHERDFRSLLASILDRI